MGVDDRDEGGGGCLEHDHEPVAVTLAPEGAYVEQVCTRCGSVMVQTPTGLTGGAD